MKSSYNNETPMSNNINYRTLPKTEGNFYFYIKFLEKSEIYYQSNDEIKEEDQDEEINFTIPDN